MPLPLPRSTGTRVAPPTCACARLPPRPFMVVGRRYRARWRGDHGSSRGLWRITVDLTSDCDQDAGRRADGGDSPTPRRTKRKNKKLPFCMLLVLALLLGSVLDAANCRALLQAGWPVTTSWAWLRPDEVPTSWGQQTRTRGLVRLGTQPSPTRALPSACAPRSISLARPAPIGLMLSHVTFACSALPPGKSFGSPLGALVVTTPLSEPPYPLRALFSRCRWRALAVLSVCTCAVPRSSLALASVAVIAQRCGEVPGPQPATIVEVRPTTGRTCCLSALRMRPARILLAVLGTSHPAHTRVALATSCWILLCPESTARSIARPVARPLPRPRRTVPSYRTDPSG